MVFVKKKPYKPNRKIGMYHRDNVWVKKKKTKRPYRKSNITSRYVWGD